MKRVDLYKQILKAVDVEVGEDDRLYRVIEESREPLVYEGKHFYLPTKQVLSKSALETDGYLFFDPLTESALRQESDSVKLLRRLMLTRLQICVSLIVSNLIKVLGDESYAKRVKGNQALLYRQNIVTTKTTKRSYNSLLRKGFKDTVTSRIINIFLKRGGTIEGERYARIATVNFPILDAMDDKLNSIFGVEMPAKDKNAILQLISFVLFGSNGKVDDEYSAGSNIKMAPYFQALCFAFCNVAHRINTFHRTYKSLYDPEGNSPAASKIHIDLSFEENIQELNIFKKDPMPVLAGNTGGLTKKAEEEQKEQQANEAEEENIEKMMVKQEVVPPKPKVETRLEVKEPQQVVETRTPTVVPRVLSAGKSFASTEPVQQTNSTIRSTVPRVRNVAPQQKQQVVKKVVVVEDPQPPIVEEVLYIDVNGNPIDPRLIPQIERQQAQGAGYGQRGYAPPSDYSRKYPPANPNQGYDPRGGYSNGNRYDPRVPNGYGNGYGNYNPNPTMGGYGGYSSGVNRYTGRVKNTRGY